jgi:hypothetical protein
MAINIANGIKYIKLQLNKPNDHKIYQHLRFATPCKIYPNWELWCENIPSGNPVLELLITNSKMLLSDSGGFRQGD